jgi:hypothetical protein
VAPTLRPHPGTTGAAAATGSERAPLGAGGERKAADARIRRERAAARREVGRARAAAMQRHPSGRVASGSDVTPPSYVDSMDHDAHLPTGTDDAAAATRATRAAVARAAQPALPFDDAADRPIPFSLTARARRVVAPQGLPPLTVVPSEPETPAPAHARTPQAHDRTSPPRRREDDDPPGERPGDTRPARARALRRAGVGPAAIARKLDVDELLVRAWVGDAVVAAVPAPPEQEPADDQEATAFALARAAATEEARGLVRTDAGFAAGLGLVAAVMATDPHAATFATTRPDLAARIIGWLCARAGVQPGALRVVLRLGPGVAGDLARHRWAEELGVPVAGVVHTRWHGAPAPDAVEALVRIPDPRVAATLAGWCDALLEPAGGDAADLPF